MKERFAEIDIAGRQPAGDEEQAAINREADTSSQRVEPIGAHIGCRRYGSARDRQGS